MTTDAREEALQRLPLLNFLPPDVRELVVESFEPTSYAFGQEMAREGEAADAFYLVVSGRARMVRKSDSGDEISLGQLRAGDTFGEAGLLGQAVHAATIRASSDVEALRLDRAVFSALLRQ